MIWRSGAKSLRHFRPQACAGVDEHAPTFRFRTGERLPA